MSLSLKNTGYSDIIVRELFYSVGSMKIIVFSDSHGNTAAMETAVRTEQPGLILHLGDHEYDCDCLSVPIRSVRVKGNCDSGSNEQTERFIDFGGVKLLMTHGHLYGVKRDISSLLRRGIELGADIILYGHTHRQYLSKDSALTVMNPGTPDTSYGILEITNGKCLHAEIIER